MTEKLSALFDGAADEAALPPTLESLKRDVRMREKWGMYCLIGDAIRGEHQGEADLTARVMARLELEPTVLSPLAPRPGVGAQPRRNLGWILMPLAASVMGVAVVGWAVQLLRSEEPGINVARAPAAAVSPVAQFAAPKDDPYRQYVFAHQTLAGGGAMPSVAQYVRTVAEGRPGLE
ncbi:MAG: sigma-E factor negative regulatory protein [Rhodocyclaceae bacterium]|jgi:sigma-E factor negative regulatory protein RseA|nr:sigma-E factor negative regulatory protein [Rhodocyclaceae bacterium]